MNSRADGTMPADPMKILLVEDDPVVRDVVATVLEMAGHDVTQASDGAEALATLGMSGIPTLLVTDINLPPPMDGIALSRALRTHSAGMSVVYISGELAERNREQAVAHSVILEKPFRRASLLDAVARALSNSAS